MRRLKEEIKEVVRWGGALSGIAIEISTDDQIGGGIFGEKVCE